MVQKSKKKKRQSFGVTIIIFNKKKNPQINLLNHSDQYRLKPKIKS